MSDSSGDDSDGPVVIQKEILDAWEQMLASIVTPVAAPRTSLSALKMPPLAPAPTVGPKPVPRPRTVFNTRPPPPPPLVPDAHDGGSIATPIGDGAPDIGAFAECTEAAGDVSSSM